MTSQAGVVPGDGAKRLPGQDEHSNSAISSAPAGNCDRIEGADVFGWAWRPSDPAQRLQVEQWVDGVLAGAVTANKPRGDLQAQGKGDGRYGWGLRLALDPYKTRPQRVEIRLASGELLPGGAFDLVFDPSMLAAETSDDIALIDQSADAEQLEKLDSGARQPFTEAAFDGLEGEVARGWAWRPDFPEQHVQVEQWVDGQLVDKTVADLSRPDLGAVGKGHGRYGWQMPLKLDPNAVYKQAFDFRVTGGDAIAGGHLELLHSDVVQAAPDDHVDAGVSDEPEAAVGWYDGLKGSTLHGWAWNPARPDEQIEVELWIDGMFVRGVVANGFRPDLRANGVGHGRYGWRFPIEMNPDRVEPLKVEIRIKGGPAVGGGIFEMRNDLSLDDPANASLKPFVLSVLEPAPVAARTSQPPRPKTALLVYCPAVPAAGKFWAREYDDYLGAMEAFKVAVSSIGEAVEVATVDEANAVCVERRANGEECILFSFGSPRHTPLDAACPVIPVLSWAFPTIPTGMWDGDRRSDWRYVLRTTGHAIALSRFAAEAVKSVMGRDYPVIALPAPIVDRVQPVALPVMTARSLSIDGVIFDSRDHALDPNNTELPAPIWSGVSKQSITVDGVLFAAAMDFNDGRRNLKDVLSAFVVAHRDNADATLLLRLDEPNPDWWQELYKALSRLPHFSCRVVAMRGHMDNEDWDALVSASHWFVVGSKAEGLSVSLQRFMSAARPAISPVHSALAEYVDSANALLVASDEEAWVWPDDSENEGWSWTQHPMDVGPTTRHRISWSSLSAALAEGYRLSKEDPKRYAVMSQSARKAMQAFCSDAVATAKLDAFLRLVIQPPAVSPPPSELMAGSPE